MSFILPFPFVLSWCYVWLMQFRWACSHGNYRRQKYKSIHLRASFPFIYTCHILGCWYTEINFIRYLKWKLLWLVFQFFINFLLHYFKMENSGVLWIINVSCCLGAIKEKVSYPEINSGCDFHENIEEMHKTYPIGVYLLNYLVLVWYKAVLGIFIQ